MRSRGSNTGAHPQDSAAPFTFFGRILRAADDAPIAGAKVTFVTRALPGRLNSGVANRGEFYRDGILGEFATDANGLFSATATSRSGCLACVEAEGYARRTVLITAEHATREAAAVIRLWRGAVVCATVTNGTGQPLSGITVRLSGSIAEFKDKPGWDIRVLPPIWTAETDSRGQCTLAGIYPDTGLTVALERGGDTLPCPSPGIIRLQPGEERELQLQVVEKIVLGVMLDQRDIPVSRCEVWVQDAESSGPHLFWSEDPVARTLTDSNGHFEFSLAPGLWNVGPGIPLRGEFNDERSVAPLAQAVRIEESGGDQEIILRVHRAGIELRLERCGKLLLRNARDDVAASYTVRIGTVLWCAGNISGGTTAGLDLPATDILLEWRIGVDPVEVRELVIPPAGVVELSLGARK
ncbi:MAG: hypothetical protein AB1486_01550 [Planctomycetota bacterium]